MKKKLLSILLVLSLMLALVPTAFAADIVDSGTCGADGDGSSVTWTLDAAGLLTISGTGKIIDGDGGSIWSGKPVMAVDIRSGITAVGSNAFFGCDQLQVISLPDTVTQLDKNAFGNCAALSSILVDAKNPAYKSVDGALYSKDGTVLIKCPADAETFVVPDGVTPRGESWDSERTKTHEVQTDDPRPVAGAERIHRRGAVPQGQIQGRFHEAPGPERDRLHDPDTASRRPLHPACGDPLPVDRTVPPAR